MKQLTNSNQSSPYADLRSSASHHEQQKSHITPSEVGDKQGTDLIRRIDEHSYVISLAHKAGFSPDKSTLTDIHTDLLRNKRSLASDQGYIRIKEYSLESYPCRCHERQDSFDNGKIDLHKDLIDYKLQF